LKRRIVIVVSRHNVTYIFKTSKGEIAMQPSTIEGDHGRQTGVYIAAECGAQRSSESTVKGPSFSTLARR